MDSTGPSLWSLAQDLLQKGERDTVLQYFELCRKFWEMGKDSLDQWTKDVKAGHRAGLWSQPCLLNVTEKARQTTETGL